MIVAETGLGCVYDAYVERRTSFKVCPSHSFERTKDTIATKTKKNIPRITRDELIHAVPRHTLTMFNLVQTCSFNMKFFPSMTEPLFRRSQRKRKRSKESCAKILSLKEMALFTFMER